MLVNDDLTLGFQRQFTEGSTLDSGCIGLGVVGRGYFKR